MAKRAALQKEKEVVPPLPPNCEYFVFERGRVFFQAPFIVQPCEVSKADEGWRPLIAGTALLYWQREFDRIGKFSTLGQRGCVNGMEAWKSWSLK